RRSAQWRKLSVPCGGYPGHSILHGGALRKDEGPFRDIRLHGSIGGHNGFQRARHPTAGIEFQQWLRRVLFSMDCYFESVWGWANLCSTLGARGGRVCERG